MTKIHWFAGAIIYRMVDGVLELLLQDSTTTIPKYRWQGVQTKFPGGRNKDHPEDSTFLDTLKRELFEELHIRLKDDSELKVIYDVIQGDHRKIFYLVSVEAFEGEIRQVPQWDATTILSVPRWVRVDESLYRKIYRTHRSAFRSAMLFLNKVS